MAFLKIPYYLLLLALTATLIQAQLSLPPGTFDSEDGANTFAVYNGKVFQIPKKEESSWFNFSLLDNALVRTLLGWSDYFSGASSQPDMIDEINLAASQNTAQYALPGQQPSPGNWNGLQYGDAKPAQYRPPFPGQQQPPPPPPQPLPFGNPPFQPQYPPRPMQPGPGNFPQQPYYQPGPSGPGPQVPMNAPRPPYQGPPSFPSAPRYNLPSVEMVTHVFDEGNLDHLVVTDNTENPNMARFFESAIGDTMAERSDGAPASFETRAKTPCPRKGQWKFENGLCVALGNFPKWACKPSDLVGNNEVVVCRKKIWFPQQQRRR